MIDDDDVTHMLLAWPVLGPVSLVIGIVVVGIMAAVSCENEEECARQKCAHGHGKVVDNECLCVETPDEGKRE